ncbi:hypothetical protein [Nocardia aurantia]|uniref:hypothetical protein n=1 Tax=Nocardia aurantia TaxID=2585199 RepID=UPI001294C1BF|nr:hypothetical protein [Nocardia aurantia]
MNLMTFLREQMADPSMIADTALDFNPLEEDDGLLEAQVLDILYEVAAGVVWILLDCRGALHVDEGNAAIIAFESIEHLEWRGNRRSGWYSHIILTSNCRVSGSSLSFELGLNPQSRLVVTAGHGRLFVGDVPGCDDAPPDFTEDDDRTIRAGLANWQSRFMPAYSISVGDGASKTD